MKYTVSNVLKFVFEMLQCEDIAFFFSSGETRFRLGCFFPAS